MSINPLSTPKDSSLWQPNRSLNKLVEAGVKAIFATFAFISVATTIGIVLTLVFETVSFFEKVPIGRFLTETQWTPLFANQQFGIMVLLSATLLTSAIAIAVALPVGLLIAVCLSEYAPAGLRKWLKPALEILAGVPTVVFGYFALLTVTPFLQTFIPGLQGFNALSAGIVLGISIIPLVASLSEDAIYAVPQSLRNGSYALGATKRETIVSVVLPAALSGIVASFILSISRAIGETMIVTIAAGQNPRNTIFAVGMTLFLITLALNIFSYWFVRRFREKYE